MPRHGSSGQLQAFGQKLRCGGDHYSETILHYVLLDGQRLICSAVPGVQNKNTLGTYDQGAK
jgi:hypothetical protein